MEFGKAMEFGKTWEGDGREFVLAIVNQSLDTILNFGMKEKQRKHKRERLNIIVNIIYA